MHPHIEGKTHNKELMEWQRVTRAKNGRGKNTVFVGPKLNRNTDADILRAIEGNRARQIKRLVRACTGKGQMTNPGGVGAPYAGDATENQHEPGDTTILPPPPQKKEMALWNTSMAIHQCITYIAMYP